MWVLQNKASDVLLNIYINPIKNTCVGACIQKTTGKQNEFYSTNKSRVLWNRVNKFNNNVLRDSE